MSFRRSSLAVACLAMVASLFVAAGPAQAAPTGTITGTIAWTGGPVATDVKVELWRLGTRNRDRLISVQDVPSSGGFGFSVASVVSKRPATYKLHIIGKADGQRRSWWWRGGNGSFAGGAREQNAGSKIVLNAANGYAFRANAAYGAIEGNVRRGSVAVGGTEVTVIGRPPYWSRSSKALRDLDIMSCAYVYGRAVTDGNGYYRVGFLPVNAAGTYAVKSENSMWNSRWGSCHAAVNYRSDPTSTPRMLTLPGGSVRQDIDVAAGRTAVSVDVNGYQGPASTAKVDRFLTVREYSPGRKVLASDVIRATTGRDVTLGEGYYWFEIGRRTGCSAWYKSRYANNDGYFNGLDRSFEKWKARNYRMYRQHCRAYTAGAFKLVYVAGASTKVTLTNSKGGSVSGRVTAAKIKPRTELMVRLTSSAGTKVYRTAMTDGAGRFKVTGLAPGRYRVIVNADSWRGISRSFTGKKVVTVKKGKNRSIGTLRFRQ